jgi:hypothetical protein
MDKKFLSLFILLILFISMIIAVSYLYQSPETDDQFENSIDSIDEGEIINELDNFFIDEEDEVEIGEMI